MAVLGSRRPASPPSALVLAAGGSGLVGRRVDGQKAARGAGFGRMTPR